MTWMSFERELMEFERELTDIKTAARKAFGTLNFYEKTASYQSPASPSYDDSFFTIVATAKAGEVAPFFCQLAFGGTEDLIAENMVPSDTSITWTFYYNSIEGALLNFRAIATSDFDLTVRAGR